MPREERRARDPAREHGREREREPQRHREPEQEREPEAEGEGEGERERERPRRARRPAVDARGAARSAARAVQELTGRDPEGVTSLEHREDGWVIGIEVLETRRIPDSTDILAEYRVELDDRGELVTYRRDHRYYRGRSQEGT